MIDIILCLLKTIVAYFVLMIISTTLLGFIVRGFFVNPELIRIHDDSGYAIKNELNKIMRADNYLTLLFIALTVAYLYLLFHFWNIWMVMAAILFMISRFQDLLREIKTGEKTSKSTIPKGFLSKIISILAWIPMIILWFVFYK